MAAKRMAAGASGREKALKRIFAAVAGGRAVEAVLAGAKSRPSAATFWRWHGEDEQVREDLESARERGAGFYVGEIVPIADDVADNAASRKVRIDARVKVAQMIAPGKYGARSDPAGGGDRFAIAEEVEAARRRMADAP